MSFVVLTDSGANIPKHLLEEHNIDIIPFAFFIDGKKTVIPYFEDFNLKNYYEKLGKGEISVKTSQINPEEYQIKFEEYLKNGKDLIYISLSSGISGSYNSSRIAAEELKEKYPDRKIKVIDTKGASMGEGLVAIYAAKLNKAEVSFETAVDKIYEFIENLCQVFTVDDLMYLKRGGRVSTITAAFGTVLNIKPLLKGNENGNIVTNGRVRGRKAAIEALALKYNDFCVNPENQVVAIAHTACEEEAKILADLINKKRPPKEVLVVDYEPMTGAHVGPGAIALFFEAFKGVRLK